jgi:hypothetical protein
MRNFGRGSEPITLAQSNIIAAVQVNVHQNLPHQGKDGAK